MLFSFDRVMCPSAPRRTIHTCAQVYCWPNGGEGHDQASLIVLISGDLSGFRLGDRVFLNGALFGDGPFPEKFTVVTAPTSENFSRFYPARKGNRI